MGKKSIILLLTLTIFGMTIFVNPSSLASKLKRFESISIHDGLSQNGVYAILQDSRGMMWFGTQDGLNRYDGYSFKIYRFEANNPNSLVNTFIYVIYESPNDPGVLWIGTAGGLTKFDTEYERFYSFKNDSRFDNWLKNITIKHIIEDSDGNLWLGTFGEGLNKIDLKTYSFKRFKNDPDNKNFLGTNNVTALVQDDEGNLWIGSDGGGLCKFNYKKNIFKKYNMNFRKYNTLTNNWIMSLCCDKDGEIWVGTDGDGLIRIQRDQSGNEKFKYYFHSTHSSDGLISNHIKKIYQDQSGLLWIGLSGGGLCSLNKNTGEFKNFSYGPERPYGLRHFNIEAIFQDKAGTVWFGTYGGGIKILNQKKIFLHYTLDPYKKFSLKHNEIWDIMEDTDNFYWIATNGGLYQFNLEKDTFHLLEHNIDSPEDLNFNRIFCICKDYTGDLWLGSDGGGLYKYHRKKNKFTRYSSSPLNPKGISQGIIRTIILDHQKILWLGTLDKGICCLYPENRGEMIFERFLHIPGDSSSLSSNRVLKIKEGPNGIIWICTWGGGLNRFNRESKTFSKLKINNLNEDFARSQILELIFDSFGTMWIGTTNGLIQYNQLTNNLFHYSTQNGLPNDIIYGILEDNPQGSKDDWYLWISTNKGLSRFNPKTGEFKNYDISDGLQSNEFNIGASLKSKDGLMFFGGINGFNIFNPRKLHINQYVPPLVLTDFQIFYKPVPIDSSGKSPLKKSIMASNLIKLNYKQNTFSFQFAALNYINCDKNQYAYQLQGFDKDWIYLNKRQMASYTNVPPGDYIFRVKGSNNDGIWNNEGVSVSVTITPPFWQTWWFKLLMVLVFLLILDIIHRMRTAVIEQRMEKRRLENELKLKADFTAMLVHDLRSPLTAVIGYAELLSEYSDSIDVNKTGKIIAKSSGKMLNLINDMLDLSKFEAGKMNLNQCNVHIDSLIKVISDIIEILRPLIDRKSIKLIWTHTADELLNLKNPIFVLDLEKIGQVIHNILSNAIKFTPPRGMIFINLKYIDSEFLEIAISDEGPGIPTEKQKYLFDKYAQLKNENRFKGTGLGLAVSKLIVSSHNGDIGYRKGDNGKGSTFYFRLPLINITQ